MWWITYYGVTMIEIDTKTHWIKWDKLEGPIELDAYEQCLAEELCRHVRDAHDCLNQFTSDTSSIGERELVRREFYIGEIAAHCQDVIDIANKRLRVRNKESKLG